MVTPGTYVEEKTSIASIADLSRIRLVGWVPETAAATMRELIAQQGKRIQVNKTALPLGGFLAGPWPGLGSRVGRGCRDGRGHVAADRLPEARHVAVAVGAGTQGRRAQRRNDHDRREHSHSPRLVVGTIQRRCPSVVCEPEPLPEPR
jgi:hypothetical protein